MAKEMMTKIKFITGISLFGFINLYLVYACFNETIQITGTDIMVPQTISNVMFGIYTILIVAFLVIGINIAMKYKEEEGT